MVAVKQCVFELLASRFEASDFADWGSAELDLDAAQKMIQSMIVARGITKVRGLIRFPIRVLAWSEVDTERELEPKLNHRFSITPEIPRDVLQRFVVPLDRSVAHLTGQTCSLWDGSSEDWFECFPPMFREHVVLAIALGVFGDAADDAERIALIREPSRPLLTADHPVSEAYARCRAQLYAALSAAFVGRTGDQIHERFVPA